MAKILCLTLNPALDLSIRLTSLAPGEVNRAESTQLAAAGKGVNVARVLVALGHQVRVSGFLGADNDAPFRHAFAEMGVDDEFIRLPGETRINAKLAERAGRVTDINGPGLAIGREAFAALIECLEAVIDAPATRPDAVVIAGSLPPGVTPGDLAALVRQLRGQGLPVWVDTSGEALSAAIGACPTAVKPNEHELAEWAGQALVSVAERLAAASRLHASGIEEALVSSGADGVLWVGPRGSWLATPPRMTVASTVGAGDTLVAAMLHGLLEGYDAEQALGFAAALSAESVRHIGVGDPHAEDFDQLKQQTRVRRLDDADVAEEGAPQ
ncbi:MULTISPECIES: 1-phosphofructokinase [Halomonadaceae]|uniref:1-phosphofructokinase n=1 Tax=Halomonadaceae TaxID=28256 RepID=UPI001599A1BE|nr:MULTISPECIES: 1-phosphofructokinase [Halomonas]QJQ95836.1 1-phosphofructokinase [Halomonas sp. PA5]